MTSYSHSLGVVVARVSQGSKAVTKAAEWIDVALLVFLATGEVVSRGAASPDESVLGTCMQPTAGAIHARSFIRTAFEW